MITRPPSPSTVTLTPGSFTSTTTCPSPRTIRITVGITLVTPDASVRPKATRNRQQRQPGRLRDHCCQRLADLRGEAKAFSGRGISARLLQVGQVLGQQNGNLLQPTETARPVVLSAVDP